MESYTNKFIKRYIAVRGFGNLSETEKTVLVEMVEMALDKCDFRYAEGRGAQCGNKKKEGGKYCNEHDTMAKRRKNDIKP